GLGGLCWRLAFALVRQRGEEKGLVDSSLEDRHAHLHALRDDLSPLHSCFSCQLGGRQVICQSLIPPLIRDRACPSSQPLYRLWQTCQAIGASQSTRLGRAMAGYTIRNGIRAPDRYGGR